MKYSAVCLDMNGLDPPSAWYLGRWVTFLPLLFFHGIATCHSLLIGQTKLSDDPDQLLLAAADYLNSWGGVSNPWLPSFGDLSMGEQLQTDWLGPMMDPAVLWEGSAQAMGIKTQERGQVGELEILIHLEEEDMGFSIEHEAGGFSVEQESGFQAEADRKRVREIMKQAQR